MDHQTDYSKWSNAELIERVTKLELDLRKTTQKYETQSTIRKIPLFHCIKLKTTHSCISAPVEANEGRKMKPKKAFDASRYNTRLIALKFAYLGQKYNGYEHHANNTTPLPTIEEELWKALTKTKLIFPAGPEENNWQDCDYSKCGRTDKGVSAFGQVIGIRVRSNQKKATLQNDASSEDEVEVNEPVFDPVNDELSYPRLLNRVLPDDIRVLAWCPSPPPNFSARFSCRERRYRYFFTQPAYTPRADSLGTRRSRDGSLRKDGWLNIPAMQEAAGYFVGMHDFRNFCKHDPARQITNFQRHITYCAIEEASSSPGMPAFVKHKEYGMTPAEDAKLYTFTVYGSAFLWHQVRHMAAILFHVGQGLEPPSIVQELLNVDRNPTKPLYEMADDAPLVLWDCIFPAEERRSPQRPDGMRKDGLQWIYVDGQPPEKVPAKEIFALSSNGRFGPGGLQEVVWAGWRRKKIDEVLAAALLDRIALQKGPLVSSDSSSGKLHLNGVLEIPPFGALSTKVFEGDNGPRMKGEYTPIMERKRMEPIEILNARYAERKGLNARADAGSAGSDADE